MKKEDLEYSLEQIELSGFQQVTIPAAIQMYHAEYEASIKIGLNSKNYAEREKAYYNALDVMVQNGIEILPAQFNRKPSDILYNMDLYLRIIGINDKDFRRTALWLVSGEHKKLPKVSEAKDAEIMYQEEQRNMTKQARTIIQNSNIRA